MKKHTYHKCGCSVIPVSKPCHATRTELKRQNIASPLNPLSSASLFLNASRDRELITSHVMKGVCLNECGGYSLHREKGSLHVEGWPSLKGLASLHGGHLRD